MPEIQLMPMQWVWWTMPDIEVWACYLGNSVVAVTSKPIGGFTDFTADLKATEKRYEGMLAKYHATISAATRISPTERLRTIALGLSGWIRQGTGRVGRSAKR